MTSIKVLASERLSWVPVSYTHLYAQKLQEANTQVELLNELGKYMNEPGNRYQPIPSNVGLTDESSTE